MTDEPDSGVRRAEELEDLIEQIRAGVGGIPLRLEKTEVIALRKLLERLRGKEGFEARLTSIEHHHQEYCRVQEVLELLEGKNLPDGSRTRGLVVDVNDLQRVAKAHMKALEGYETEGGKRIKGLKERQDEVDTRHKEKDAASEKQEWRKDKMFWLLVTVLLGLVAHFIRQFLIWTG